jgi:pantothenate kinase
MSISLSKLISLWRWVLVSCTRDTSRFLGHDSPATPFVIGVAGSVAVGQVDGVPGFCASCFVALETHPARQARHH